MRRNQQSPGAHQERNRSMLNLPSRVAADTTAFAIAFVPDSLTPEHPS
jgi:hypothetical protein